VDLIRGWAELLTGPVKKYCWEYEMGQKDRRRNIDKPKGKRNKNR
jgi:hypothetical protein